MIFYYVARLNSEWVCKCFQFYGEQTMRVCVLVRTWYVCRYKKYFSMACITRAIRASRRTSGDARRRHTPLRCCHYSSVAHTTSCYRPAVTDFIMTYFTISFTNNRLKIQLVRYNFYFTVLLFDVSKLLNKQAACLQTTC